MRRVALFGGSFDPIHQGHLFIAEQAKKNLELDEVILIPAKQSPHKEESEPTDPEHRLNMIRLATADLDWAEVSEVEIAREEASYSWITAESFTEQFSLSNEQYMLFWIMGQDQWQSLPSWQKPERLAELVEFAVFTRNGESPEHRDGYRLHEVEGVHPASSTSIRQQLSLATDPLSLQYLHPSVALYIQSNKLYQTSCL